MGDGRQVRGRVLAEAHGDRIRHVEGALWFCPSSKGTGGYLVDVEAGRCSCPDAAERCKHLAAVEIRRAGEVPPPPAPVVPLKPSPPTRGDLTAQEQANVRAALRFLRLRSGGYEALAKGIRSTRKALTLMASSRPPNASLALRLARFARVPFDDVIAGRFPPLGACPYCGRGP